MGGSPSQQCVHIFTMAGGSLPSPPSSDHGTFHHMWFLFCFVLFCLLLLFSMAGDPSLRPFPQITEPFIICGFCFVLFCFVCCCYLAWQVTTPFAPSLRPRHLSSAVVLFFIWQVDPTLRPFPQTSALFISFCVFSTRPFPQSTALFISCCCCFPLAPSLRPRHFSSTVVVVFPLASLLGPRHFSPTVFFPRQVDPSPLPFPQTTARQIGWRSTEKNLALEKYGKYAKPKGGLVRQLKWPMEAVQ